MMGYNDIIGYYNLNFALMQHHKYSLTEIENMYPYERDIYCTLLNEFLKEQEAVNKENQQRWPS
jgi:hypothetical protein